MSLFDLFKEKKPTAQPERPRPPGGKLRMGLASESAGEKLLGNPTERPPERIAPRPLVSANLPNGSRREPEHSNTRPMDLGADFPPPRTSQTPKSPSPQPIAAPNSMVSVAPAPAPAAPNSMVSAVALGHAQAPVLGIAERKLIEALDEVPSSHGLLTVGSKAILRVPPELQFALVAVDRGGKRAAILYDPGFKRPGMPAVVGQLKANLVREGYSLDPGEYPCRGDILKKLVDNYNARHGTDSADSANVASRARALFVSWIDMAVREGATDIHIEIKNDNGTVYLRVDGGLERLRDESGGFYTALEAKNAMAYPFNLLAGRGTNSSSSWTPDSNLYCMTEPREVHGKQVSLRYQNLRGYSGPKTVCRLLNTDPNAPTLTYDQLGYSPSQKQIMLDAASIPSGFILFSGVTGSGKTTTLKTFIETHPGNGSMAFYSIEDPVEYPLRGVHQIVLQRDVGDKEASTRAYQETVASLMRADPDAVSIGEIRDTASAGAGQSLVETGHMALGTVHAHLMPGIMQRLTNAEVGMSRDTLTNPNMLTLLAYQALVPKLCPHCKFAPTDAIANAQHRDSLDGGQFNRAGNIIDSLAQIELRFKLPRDAFRFRNEDGCDKCSERGTKGQTVVAEMTMPDRRWLELTRVSKDYEAMVYYRSQGDSKFDSPDMTGKTVFEHTLYKAFTGLVDPTQCSRFDSFKRFEIEPWKTVQ